MSKVDEFDRADRLEIISITNWFSVAIATKNYPSTPLRMTVTQSGVEVLSTLKFLCVKLPLNTNSKN